MTPLYIIELDYGDGDAVTWEFYECGAVRFADRLEDVEEWTLVWEYE